MRMIATRFLLLLLVSLPAFAEIVEPHYVLYGTVGLDGAPAAPGTRIVLEVDGEQLVSYGMGENAELGNLYALRVPLDAVGERLPGHGRTGDQARIFVDGELAAVLTLGPAGKALSLDLDPGELAAGIYLGDAELFEGDTGIRIATLTVSLTQTQPADVEVDFITRDGSASAASDYVPRLGRAVIPAGDLSTTIDLEVHGDPDLEADEEFFVDLSNPLNGVLLDPEGRVAILDDDTPPSISVGDLTVTEPNPGASQNASFTAQLSHPWDADVAFNYAAVDLPGGAINGTDYLLNPDSAVIPAGHVSVQVEVVIYGDLDNEDDETFELHLSNPANASLGDGVGEATISEFVRILRWVEQYGDSLDSGEAGAGTPGLTGAFDLALSPDGQNLYVAGRASDAIAAFTRNGDGTLTHLATYENGTGGVIGLNGVEAVLVSADGTKVFAASYDDNAVVSFTRNGDGTLVFVDADFDSQVDAESTRVVDGLAGASALAETSDTAHHLYVAGFLDDAVSIFSVRGDGKLEYETTAEDGVFGADGLAQASAIEIADNGTDVYITGYFDDSVALYTRNPTDGFLTFREIHSDGLAGVLGLDGALDVRLDADGAYLYIAGQLSNAVAIFSRDDATGSLTYVGNVIDGVGGVDGLHQVTDLAFSRDPLLGDYLYATSYGDDAVAVFERQPDGRLVHLEQARDGVGGVDGIDGANALAVSADDHNVYVAGSGESKVAVFERDVIAPEVILALTSTSHGVGAPSNLTALDFEWSGASDQGFGVAEYWLLLDRQPDTMAPPEPPSLFVQHGADPHTASLSVTEDADDFHLHVTTCDLIGNCSPTHLGPFAIDTLSPSAPGGLTSPSHDAPSEDSRIVMTWNPSIDPPSPSGYASGVVGYGYSFSPAVTPECDGTVDLSDPSAATVRSEILPVGTWYFHLCAIDGAGNTATSVSGPWEILPDSTPPEIVTIDSVARSADGVVESGELLDGAITQLIVSFSESVQPAGAEDPASYLLAGPGSDGIFQSSACTLAGDDISVPLVGLSYDDEARSAALQVASLSRGEHRLSACSAIQDLRDNALINTALDFASLGNHLMNPNFDRDLSGWTLSDLSAIFLQDDADGAAGSGAARSVVTNQAETFAQCVDGSSLNEPFDYLELRGRARITERAATAVRMTASLTPFDQPSCTGTDLGLVASEEVAGDTAGQWHDLQVGLRVPAGAQSVLVGFVAVPDDAAADADVDLDRCVLLRSVLFSDGFESGDTSAWAVP